MSLIERGNTVESAIRQIRNDRTYGAETFVTKSDMTQRTGSKVFGDLRRRVERQNRGTPLARLTNNTSNSIPVVNDMFRTKNTTPLYEDGLGDEPMDNIRLVVNRQVNRPGPLFDPIQKGELAILFKNTEDNLNTCRLEGAAFTIQCNPLSIIPPAVYNYAIGQLQQREATHYKEKYRKRTPFDYWKDYSIDGIPEHISPMQNKSTIFCTGSAMVDGCGTTDSNICTMLSTMAARAPHIKVINYWGSAVKPGSHLWGVIKKFEQSDYSYDYLIGTKILTDHTGKRLAIANDCEVTPLMPYQLAFFSMPDGGPVPPEYTRYYDEEGNLRTDGHLIKFGTVAAVPLGHVFRENNARLRPFTGAIPTCVMSHYTMTTADHSSMRHNPITIMLKPNDGIYPL